MVSVIMDVCTTFRRTHTLITHWWEQERLLALSPNPEPCTHASCPVVGDAWTHPFLHHLVARRRPQPLHGVCVCVCENTDG